MLLQAVVEVEVEFVPLYVDQPLFADVDRAMRERGFVFHRFSSQQGRCMKPLSVVGNPYATLSQVRLSQLIHQEFIILHTEFIILHTEFIILHTEFILKTGPT